MPKLKTNRGAAKRFKKTGTGKYTHKKAFLRHILTSKTTAQKRGLRRTGTTSPGDSRRIKKLVPYI